MQLSANGTRILQSLGLGPAMDQVVCKVEGKELRLWSTGQAWRLFDLGQESEERYGAPYWMVHRGDLHAVLLRAVERAVPGAIRTGVAAVCRNGTGISTTSPRRSNGRCWGGSHWSISPGTGWRCWGTRPTLPFLAQGANMALEDGAILARCLAAEADIGAALRRYEAVRLERTAVIVRGSNGQYQAISQSGPSDGREGRRPMWRRNSRPNWCAGAIIG